MAKNSKSMIVGTDGQPLDLGVLQQEVAFTSYTSIRNPWNQWSIAHGLTPWRLAKVLRAADVNNAMEYHILAREMEEREPHFASVLGTRKRAVEGIEPAVEPASDSPLDIQIAEDVRTLTRAAIFSKAISGCLDALNQGFSPVEIMWDRSGKQWWPCDYKWRDQRFFKFDWDTAEQLLLIDTLDPMGVPLPPYKFIIHYPQLRMGIPTRGGLARLVAMSYVCKSFTLADWMAFCEVFGMPLRVGRYSQNATAPEKQILADAVANLGSDFAAILPEGMHIEFTETASRSGGDSLYLNLVNFLDQQTSKAVLGQTLSSDASPTGMGSGTSNLQGEVRIDIKRSDAKQLADTLNRDLVKPFVDLNYGPQAAYPTIKLPVPDPENLTLLNQALPNLVNLGAKISEQDVMRKFGLRAPTEEETALQPKPPAPNPFAPPPADGGDDPETDDGDKGKPPRGKNTQQPGADTDTIDALADQAAGDWQPIMDPFMKPLIDLVDNAADEREFLAKLPGVLHDMKAGPAIRNFAIQAFKARGLGDGTPAPV